jgi:transcriptional regulator with XRE-family HTH domain
MGYMGKIALQEKARDLRKRGFSIKAIEKELGISRSSASLWTRDVELTSDQLKSLYADKRTGAWRGCVIAARKKKEATEIAVREAGYRGNREVGKLSKRDRLMAGIALYLGEGDKSGRNVAFCNADPRAIRFMMRWFREVCAVAEERFRLSLYLHDNLDEKIAKKYWSTVTDLPLTSFRKSYIVKNNPNRLRKTKHVYGIVRITVSDAALYRRIMGLISGVFGIY